MKQQKGFTLIEVIIYIALFSLLMGAAFITAFEIIDNSDDLSFKNTTQKEGNFVLRKIDWALTGAQTVIAPTSGTTNNLRLTKYDGSNVEICLHANKIKIKEGSFGACSDSSYLPITTDNVSVSALNFEFIAASGTGPSGIKAIGIIDGSNFTITKYLRK